MSSDTTNIRRELAAALIRVADDLLEQAEHEDAEDKATDKAPDEDKPSPPPVPEPTATVEAPEYPAIIFSQKAGVYAIRLGPGAEEWLYGADGGLRRFATEEAARAAKAEYLTAPLEEPVRVDEPVSETPAAQAAPVAEPVEAPAEPEPEPETPQAIKTFEIRESQQTPGVFGVQTKTEADGQASTDWLRDENGVPAAFNSFDAAERQAQQWVQKP